MATAHMNKLIEARKKLEAIRKDLVQEILEAVSSADDQQLTRVAAIFWPKSSKSNGAKVTKKPYTVQTVTVESSKNAMTGQEAVARGERPPFKKAIMIVMGGQIMNATQIVEALKAKKWMPESSDPRQYVSYMLSTNTPGIFERTRKRGFYRVRSKVTAKWVWTVIRRKAQASFTLSELAGWLSCEMNQLRSIVFSLQQQNKLVRDDSKHPSVYRVCGFGPLVSARTDVSPALRHALARLKLGTNSSQIEERKDVES
jgi:hypothetical protein